MCSDLRNQFEEGQLWERLFFNSLVSVILTLACLYIIGYFLKYVPNDIDMGKINAVYFINPISICPEAPERAAYIMTTFLFPTFFVLFYLLVSKIKIKQSVILYSGLIFPVVLFLEILICYIENAANPYIFRISLLYKAPLLTIICSIFLFLLLRIPQQKNQNIRKIMEFSCLTVCVLSTFYVTSLYLTGTPTLNSATFHDFDVYYYPVFEVFNGKVLTVDFNNIYGFYPYLLVPILKLTGSISIQKFSFIVAVLILITLGSLLAVVWINIKNKIIAFVGFFTIAFFISILPLSSGEFYYAYQPHRIIFPALILLVGSLFIHSKKRIQKNITICIGFITACLSLIWNLDTGVVVTIAWCLLLLYTAALDYSLNSWTLYKRALIIILCTILTAATSYGIIALITFEKSGVWMSINQCFFAQNIFYNFGFNMIPLYIDHPWVILVILYAIGLIISLRNLKFLANDKMIFQRSRSSLYFFSSIMGVGVFSYYQGRSHDNVFLAVIWPGVIIAVMLLEDYYNNVMAAKSNPKMNDECKIYRKLDSGLENKMKDKSESIIENNSESKFRNELEKVICWTNFSKYILLLFLLTSFMLAVPYTIINNPGFYDMQHGSSSEFSSKVNNTVTMLKKTIGNESNVNLLIAQQDYYYTLLGMENRTGLTSSVDWFKREDYDKALQWLNTNREDVIMDVDMLGILADYSNQEIYSMIHSRYEVQDIGEGYYLLSVK